MLRCKLERAGAVQEHARRLLSNQPHLRTRRGARYALGGKSRITQLNAGRVANCHATQSACARIEAQRISL